mgnify:FL=1|jgi:hypothetical protein
MILKKTVIIIFAYNRPSHLKRVLIALENNKVKNDIYLIIDGPKNKFDKINQEDISLSLTRFSNKNKRIVKIIKRKKNLGLAKSITGGITYLSKKYQNLIILEDDTIAYKNFIRFVEKHLKLIKSSDNTQVICGYQFPNFEKNPKTLKTLLLSNFVSWGWAIKSREWQAYLKFKKKNKKKNIKAVPIFLRNYFEDKYTVKQKKNIWSLDFMYYNFIKGNKYIFPNTSLIKNIGFDGSGVNSKATTKLQVKEDKVNKFDFTKLNSKTLINRQTKIISKNLKLFY